MVTRDPRPFLTVSHYIYLTRDQRQSVFDEKLVEAVGVSIPVWFKSGNTSEPAKEVFCKYAITSESCIRGILGFEEGYKINLKSFDSSTDLSKILDVRDGGIEEITAKGYGKVNIDGKFFNAFHCVEIKPIEVLMDTIS